VSDAVLRRKVEVEGGDAQTVREHGVVMLGTFVILRKVLVE
jgi:hypothetical protein